MKDSKVFVRVACLVIAAIMVLTLFSSLIMQVIYSF